MTMMVMLKIDGTDYDMSFDTNAGISLFHKEHLEFAALTPADFVDLLKKEFSADEKLLTGLKTATHLANTMSLCHAFSGQEDNVSIMMAPDGAHRISIHGYEEIIVDNKKEWPGPYLSIIQTCTDMCMRLQNGSDNETYNKILSAVREYYPKFTAHSGK